MSHEQQLKLIIHDILWMAARYAHGRNTYASSIVREAVKTMQTIYPDWKPKEDHVIQPPDPKDIKGSNFREDYLDDIFNPNKK